MNKKIKIARATARFWGAVQVLGEDDCWEWQSRVNRGGYGYLWVDDRSVSAHRFSWQIHFGEIPNEEGHHGICVLHKCDNRKCVNPKHLFLGTHKDNVDDMVAKGRKPHIINPGLRKLSDSQIEEVKALLAKGVSMRKIAAEYSVSHTAIWQVSKGISYQI